MPAAIPIAKGIYSFQKLFGLSTCAMMTSTMKRKIGFLLTIGTILLVVTIGLKVFGGKSKKPGVLKINSNPTASIFLSDKHLGRTPYEEKADVGSYSLKLVPETTVTSLASWQGSIKVTPGLLTFVNANLSESEFTTAVDVLWLEAITSKSSEIGVTTEPDAASVVIDGELKGISPLSLPNILPADHTMTITSPGYVTRTVRVRTTAGFKVNAIIKLALSPGGEQPKEATTASTLVIPDGKTTPKATPTSGTSANPAKPYVVIKDSVKDTAIGALRVRMEPSTTSTESARVNAGDKFTILDAKNGWYQIKYDGTNTGWISGQYADKVE